MFSTRLRPVCRYDIDVGQRRSGPELVSKSQVVANERAHSEGLTVGHHVDGEELRASCVVLVLADITERVDLGIALYLARGLGHDRDVARPAVRTVPLRDGADQVAAVLPGLVDEELLVSAAGVLGDAFRLHREPGREHLS